jgi:hypothetical protein
MTQTNGIVEVKAAHPISIGKKGKNRLPRPHQQTRAINTEAPNENS